MNEQWQYQLRVYLTDDLADVARSDRNNPVLRPLTDILDKHHATLVNQFDAFASYVVEAEEEGPENSHSTNGRRQPSKIPPSAQSTSRPLRCMSLAKKSIRRLPRTRSKPTYSPFLAVDCSRGCPDTTRIRQTTCRCRRNTGHSNRDQYGAGEIAALLAANALHGFFGPPPSPRNSLLNTLSIVKCRSDLRMRAA